MRGGGARRRAAGACLGIGHITPCNAFAARAPGGQRVKRARRHRTLRTSAQRAPAAAARGVTHGAARAGSRLSQSAVLSPCSGDRSYTGVRSWLPGPYAPRLST